MKATQQSLTVLGLAAATFMASAGCSSWSAQTKPGQKTWNPKTWFKNEFQDPVSIATIWKADALAELGGPEQRGFGARVYFYNERSQAIPVDGDLVVHGYLTTPGSSHQSKDSSDQKFAFSASQLASQYSPSDLGASYSIWVPWDANQGYREEVTLIATFKSKNGAVVQSAPTRLFLPGMARFPENEPLSSQPIQQVSFRHQSIPTYDVGPAPAKSNARVTTIDLPQTAIDSSRRGH